MKTIFYTCLSKRELPLKQQIDDARRSGFEFDDNNVLFDEGLSGSSLPLRERPQGGRLFATLQAGDTLLVRWLDRLGRNYKDAADTVRELMEHGVVTCTVIGGLKLDAAVTDPMQEAKLHAHISFLAALAEAQAGSLKIAQQAGIEHAKAEAAERPRIYKGRKPSFGRPALDLVVQLLAANESVSAIADQTGLTRQTVMRIRADPAAADEALRAWGE